MLSMLQRELRTRGLYTKKAAEALDYLESLCTTELPVQLQHRVSDNGVRKSVGTGGDARPMRKR